MASPIDLTETNERLRQGFARNPVIPNRLGQIQQAMARNSARRGATPNAPGVPNELPPAGMTPAPGVDLSASNAALRENFASNPVIPNRPAMRSVQGTIGGVAQQAGPQRLAAFDPAALPVNEAFGYGVRTGDPTAVAPAGVEQDGSFDAYEQSAIANSREGTTTGIPGATVAASPAPPRPPATPTSPATIGTAATEERNFVPASGTPDAGQAVASNLPAGVTRDGNAYSGVGTAGETPVAPYGSDANPDSYRQQYRQMQQDEAMGQQSRTQAMAAHALQAGAWTDRNKAENEARVARFRATNGADMVLASGAAEYDDQRRAIMADAVQKGIAAEQARTGYNQAGMNAATAGARNFVAEGAIQSDAANRDLLARQAIANQATMRPLEKREREQRIAGMEQANKIGGFQVAGAQREADLLDQISKATTAEERTNLLDALIGLRGGAKLYPIDVDTGQVDPMTGAPIYKRAVVNQAGRIITPESQQGKEPLPEGMTPEQARAKIDADVKSGKATKAQGDAEKRKYKL